MKKNNKAEQKIDSRIIYKAANFSRTIVWEKTKAGDEWIYVGTRQDVKSNLLYQKIEEIYKNSCFLISRARDNSIEIELGDFGEEILITLGDINFKLCDKSFTRFIEYNKIGVIRIGSKQS
jgi:hypothetical protein